MGSATGDFASRASSRRYQPSRLFLTVLLLAAFSAAVEGLQYAAAGSTAARTPVQPPHSDIITHDNRLAQNSEDGDPSGENDDGGGNGSCTAYEIAKAGVVGAAVTTVAVPLIVLFGVGLSPCGPVAGGWFAANQGAAISAASTMAWLQSLAMGGNAVAAWIIGCVSAATGGGSGAYLMHLLGCSQE